VAASLYQLGIGIQASDEASVDIDRVSAAMQGLFESVEQLRSAGVDATIGSIGQAASDLSNSMAEEYQDALGSIAPLAEAATDALEEHGDSAVEALLATSNEMASTETVAEGFFESMKGGFDDWYESLQGLGDSLNEVTGAMTGFGDSGFGEAALQYEDVTQKLGTALGRGKEGAQAFRDEISASAARTQYSIGEYLNLASGLSEVGVAFDTLSVKSQDNMVALANSFGVSGQQIGMMTRLLPQMGGSLDETMDSAVGFANALNVDARGALQALPGLVEFAREQTAQFSSEIVDSGPGVVKSLMKTGAVFSKVFGKDMTEAIGMAQQHFGMMTEELNTFSNVFIGMSDSFGPLTEGLMETGMSIFQIQDLMRQGQEDPIAFAGAIRNLSDALGEGSIKQRRMMEALRTGGVDMTLIRDTNAYNSAIAAQIELNRQQSGELGKTNNAFEDLTQGTLDTAKEMKAMFSNVKEGIMIALHTAGVVQILNDAFEGAKNTLASFNDSIVKFIRGDEFKGWVEAVKPTLVAIGKGFLLLGTAVGAMTGAFAGFFAFGKVLPVVGKAAKVALGPLRLLGGALATFGGLFAGGGGVIVRGFKEFGKTLGSIAGLVPRAGAAIGGFFGRFSFFTKMADSTRRAGSAIATTIKGLGASAAGMAGRLGSGIAAKGGILAGFFTRNAGKLASTRLGTWIAGVFGGLKGKLAAMGAKIAGKGGFFKVVGKAIPGLGQIIAVISGVVTAVKDMGEVMSDPNASGAEKFQALLRGVLKGAAETINSLFLGIPGMILKKFFPGMERTFDKGFAGVMDKVFGGDGLSATIGKWWDKGTAFIGKMLGKVPALIKSALPSLKSFGSALGGVMGGLAGLLWDGFVFGVKTIWKYNPIRMLVDWMMSDDSAATEGEGHMYETMLSIGQAGLDALGSIGSGMLDGLFKSMGSSLDIALLQMELAWVGLKNTMSETWNGIKVDARDKWNRIGNAIMAATNSFLIDPMNMAITSLAMAFPNMFKSMAENMKSAFDALPDSFPGVESMRDGADSMIKSLSTVASAIPQIARVAVQSESELVSARNRMISEEISADEAASTRRESRLAAALGEAKTVAKNTRDASTSFRAWKNEEAQGLDGILSQFRKSEATRGKFNTRQMDAAERSLEDHLDSTMRSLNTRVRAGNLTLDAAKSEWVKSVAEGRAEAIRAGNATERRENEREESRQSAADASKRAGGNKGISGAQWAQFLGRLEQSRASDPSTSKITLLLKGGDKVSKILAKETNRRNRQGAANSGAQ
jgi:hypothetical protein